MTEQGLYSHGKKRARKNQKERYDQTGAASRPHQGAWAPVEFLPVVPLLKGMEKIVTLCKDCIYGTNMVQEEGAPVSQCNSWVGVDFQGRSVGGQSPPPKKKKTGRSPSHCSMLLLQILPSPPLCFGNTKALRLSLPKSQAWRAPKNAARNWWTTMTHEKRQPRRREGAAARRGGGIRSGRGQRPKASAARSLGQSRRAQVRWGRSAGGQRLKTLRARPGKCAADPASNARQRGGPGRVTPPPPFQPGALHPLLPPPSPAC